MKTRDDYFEEKRRRVEGQSSGRPPESVLGAVRLGAFGLMRMLRPLVSLGSLALLIVCVTLLVFSLTFPPGTHFPGVLVGGIALSCVALNYAYGLLMNLVEP